MGAELAFGGFRGLLADVGLSCGAALQRIRGSNGLDPLSMAERSSTSDLIRCFHESAVVFGVVVCSPTSCQLRLNPKAPRDVKAQSEHAG